MTTSDPGADLVVSDWIEAPIRLPESVREYAIGDVHGFEVQFRTVLDAMRREEGSERGRLTLLGDLIDRGPASLPALRLATMDAAALGFAERTLLLGNHEMMMLIAMSDRVDAGSIADLWVGNGGWTTLAEAGVPRNRIALHDPLAAERLRAAIGDASMAVVAHAPLHRAVGNLLFVHGGIDPSLPLADALAVDRLDLHDERHPSWIRDCFLDHEAAFENGTIVVHGHTPEYRVHESKGRPPRAPLHRLDGSRLGIDGGSYATGVVTGAAFRDGAYRIYTASA